MGFFCFNMARGESVTSWGFLFPGQGAQYPGMGKDFYDRFAVSREVFEMADDYLKRPFSKEIFEGSSAELTLTKNSQVAIFITSMAILRAVEQEYPEVKPRVCAGLSLGEYTALCAAGVIDFTTCLDLVYWRALYMHEACEKEKGGMQVVLGLDESSVAEALQAAGPSNAAWIANLNCPGQVVIAGTDQGLSAVTDFLKQKGAKRILPLEVSGAFHSGLMRSAQEKLSARILKAHLHATDIAMVMNVPGGQVDTQDQMRQCLIDQVTHPVRWNQGILAMSQMGVSQFLEMGPGKTLAGMNKRIGVSGLTLSIEKVEDLESICRYYEEKKL